jgi:hypothetical protein
MLNDNLELVAVDEALEQLITPAPVLITEQEVVLGTAAALRPRPATPHWWAEATHAMLASVRRALAPSPTHGRHDVPRRYAFLEANCMARAMERL